MTLDLTTEELQFIFSTLGQLPTSSGAYPLMMKIKAQAETPVEPAPEPEPTRKGRA